jgi:hypothetical protein
MFDDEGRLARLFDALERSNTRAATRCAACERVGRERRSINLG